MLTGTSVGSWGISGIRLLTRCLMIYLLEILVAVAGVFDLLLILSLEAIFAVWAIAYCWIWPLSSPKTQAYS